MSVKVTYKDNEIINANTDITKELKTGGKYCEGDITIQNVSDKVDSTWHQCPAAVKSYLDNVKYAANDYTTSQISDYVPATAALSNTQPVGNTIDGVVYRNNVPGVETLFASDNTAGTLKPLDALRWIYTPHIYNIRDLGGWACDGGTVKYGRIFRGREFSGGNYPTATQDDIDIAREDMRITSEIDLRGDTECDGADGIIGTADDITSSVFGTDVKYGRWAMGMYATALEQKELMKSLLNAIMADISAGNVDYIHCMGGADRTGTVCALLEAVLGVSQSDIDKDFELTSFTGEFRKRTCEGYVAMINKINTYAGSSFRDKVVNWMQSIGITIEAINAFRANMIDGTPQTLNSQVSTFTVANSLSHATTSNSSVSAVQYQPYEAEIISDNAYVIDSISVTMGGADVTDAVFNGTKTNRWVSALNTLTNCSTNNEQNAVIVGQSYGATITADEGYTLDGATISITMGGVDVSTYYSNGKIAIPNVTGNIVITATAVPSVTPITNLVDTIGYSANTRLSTTNGDNKTQNGIAAFGASKSVDNMIALNEGDVIRIKGITYTATTDGVSCFAIHNADLSVAFTSYLSKDKDGFSSWLSSISYDGDLTTITAGSAANGKYMRICGPCTAPADAVITVNQEIA